MRLKTHPVILVLLEKQKRNNPKIVAINEYLEKHAPTPHLTPKVRS